MRNNIFLLTLVLTLLAGCRKETLSPSEMLMGKWQLTDIEGTDTLTASSLYHYGTIITSINYDGDPLVINTYKAWCERDTYWNNPSFVCDTTDTDILYNLVCYIHIYDDGRIEVNEEYRDLDNTPLFGREYESTWARTEVGLNNYLFHFGISSHYWPEIENTLLFRGGYLSPVQESDITKEHLTMKIICDPYNNPGEYTYIFTRL
ncbi:MAG: hypothetical protein K8R35_01210 [Bacteroidales bacterium]|nr:hypothetical protein [Bacteroidales bacterium]